LTIQAYSPATSWRIDPSFGLYLPGLLELLLDNPFERCCFQEQFT
jgi:hypothetical protein